jgi:hypothetical protein
MSLITLIQTFDDLYLDSEQPDTNFNGSPALWVGRYTEEILKRTIVKFDLSFIPEGSTIISSNLNLYMDYDASEIGKEVSIVPYAITDGWNVSTVTLNNQPAINDGITGSASKVSIEGHYSWTITNLINQWINGGLANNGLELKTEELDLDEGKRFVSSNNTEPDKQVFKPILVIQYNPATPIPVRLNAVIAGPGLDTENEMVTTGDEYQSTAVRNTSHKTLVSFFVNNLTSNIADVGVEVSTDGVNFLRESSNSISQGIQIFIPSYDATYTRIYYKSNSERKPASLSIDYVAHE